MKPGLVTWAIVLACMAFVFFKGVSKASMPDSTSRISSRSKPCPW